ncbi:hypothetical protein M2103_001360 [Ereboglobus sp. PH5-5]|nr:hypothetical protein [Ereboglobus sp. PH5-5]
MNTFCYLMLTLAITMIATPFLHASATNQNKEELAKRMKESSGPKTFAEIEELFAELPPLFHNYSEKTKEQSEVSFDPKGYMKLAVALQKQGEEHAVSVLRKLAKRSDGSKVVALCRMLFVARKDGAFRAPMWGAPDSLPREDGKPWPLEPIAIINDIPFLVTMGYDIAGKPESASDYVEYCIAECEWNKRNYLALQIYKMRRNAPTVDMEIKAACAKLLILNVPQEKWGEKEWARRWAPFMRAQTKNWNRSLKIKPADFRARKNTLRYLLDDRFDLSSVPKEREDDFYEIIEAFIQGQHHRRDEFIYKIQFTSPDAAELQFSDSGMHGGGVASTRKENGKWVIGLTLYLQ